MSIQMLSWSVIWAMGTNDAQMLFRLLGWHKFKTYMYALTKLNTLLNFTIGQTTCNLLLLGILVIYSETSEQRTHWGQDSCLL